MGILTTQESARGFSTYVSVFGLALLVSSATYLRKLDNSAENATCAQDIFGVPETGNLNEVIFCSKLSSWRTAAIIGIIIGVIDFLLLPFLLCCATCVACGCTALFCICLSSDSDKSSNRPPKVTRTTTTTTTATTRNDVETTTTELENEAEEFVEKFKGCNSDFLSPGVRLILDILGWTFWVLGPFAGTAFITISLYKTDGIRVPNDELYNGALILFVIALLNLMVYFEKFISSVSKYVSERFCGKTTEKDNGEETTALRSNNQV